MRAWTRSARARCSRATHRRGLSRRWSTRPGTRCCAPPRCASGFRAFTTSTCRARARSCMRTIRGISSASSRRGCASLLPRSPEMQARIVPASRGARWLVEGWRIFRAAPLGWLATVIAYLMLTNLLALVPFVGLAVALVLVPPLSLGLMAAARAASHGAAVDLSVFFSASRNEPRAQIVLGIVYLGCSLAVYGVMMLADDGGALRTMLSGRAKPGEIELGDVALALFAAALAY